MLWIEYNKAFAIGSRRGFSVASRVFGRAKRRQSPPCSPLQGGEVWSFVGFKMLVPIQACEEETDLVDVFSD